MRADRYAGLADSQAPAGCTHDFACRLRALISPFAPVMAYPTAAIDSDARHPAPHYPTASVGVGAGGARERFLATILLLLWLLLAARLIELNWAGGKKFERLASRQRVVEEVVPARPGEIIDREGRIFATSVTTKSVYLVPSKTRQGWQVARRLAEALELDADQLFERIAAHPARHFLWVKRRISEAEAERVRALGLPPASWGFRDEFRRIYPQGRCASQVLGTRDIDGFGRGGIEQACDTPLRGADGCRELVQDARGRIIEVRPGETRPVRHGATVTLTLDAVIQVFAEQALDDVMQQWRPRSACAIVLEPRSGDILAMASRPTFDPNQPAEAPADAWKNRAIADIYEPGSTFKPFVVAWGLHTGCLDRNESFHCENGEYRLGRRVLHDHHPYGALSVTDILVKSSNIGMAKIGQRLTNRRLHEAAIAFGFGGPTGIELPGELPGIVRPLSQWNSYSTGSVPMGQEIAATPLQIITAYGALANNGRLVAPHVIASPGRNCEPAASSPSGASVSTSLLLPSPWDGGGVGGGGVFQHQTTLSPPSPALPPRGGKGAKTRFRPEFASCVDTNDSGETWAVGPRTTSLPPVAALRVGLAAGPSATAPIISQAVAPEVAAWVRREPLVAVVTRGTGKKAALAGCTVFGKTGTAQKPHPQTGLYSRDLHVSSFVCGAPAEDPRVLVLVSVDEPSVAHNGEHFGGSIAAPAAGELLRKVLQHLPAPAGSSPQTALEATDFSAR
ncbi:MAG: peptidoglycan D,D-transpeptidase FtsI family protein [Planctomycetaceae bacterium]